MRDFHLAGRSEKAIVFAQLGSCWAFCFSIEDNEARK
jgi:hypothetical protein